MGIAQPCQTANRKLLLYSRKKHDADYRIKRKIAGKFSTVRKAFLTLDYNYDGFIVAEDIIRLFINDNEHISYEVELS